MRAQPPLATLTVLYDGRCPVCVACRDWLASSSQLVPLTLLDAHDPLARSRFASVPWLAHELVAADERGRVWAGPAAFVVVLFCLERYRWLARWLSHDAVLPITDALFAALSTHRADLGWLAGVECDGARCDVAPVVSPYR